MRQNRKSGCRLNAFADAQQQVFAKFPADELNARRQSIHDSGWHGQAGQPHHRRAEQRRLRRQQLLDGRIARRIGVHREL